MGETLLDGRFITYRFSAPLADLVRYAGSDKTRSKVNVTHVSINKPFLEEAYGVNLDWFTVAEISNGIAFSDKMGTYWIDKDREILYYLWSD